jgi:hypothetical protein
MSSTIKSAGAVHVTPSESNAAGATSRQMEDSMSNSFLKKSGALFVGIFLIAVSGLLALGAQVPWRDRLTDARSMPLSLASTPIESPAGPLHRTEPGASMPAEEFVDYTFVFTAPSSESHLSPPASR